MYHPFVIYDVSFFHFIHSFGLASHMCACCACMSCTCVSIQTHISLTWSLWHHPNIHSINWLYHYDTHRLSWHHCTLTSWRARAGAPTRHATWVEGLTSGSRALVSCTFLIRKVQPRCIAPILLISLYNAFHKVLRSGVHGNHIPTNYLSLNQAIKIYRAPAIWGVLRWLCKHGSGGIRGCRI